MDAKVSTKTKTKKKYLPIHRLLEPITDLKVISVKLMCSKMAKNQKRSPIFFNVISDVVVKKIRDIKKNVAVSEKLSLIEK